MRIKKDDTVIVITGKDKGKTRQSTQGNAERKQSDRRRRKHSDKACRRQTRQRQLRSSTSGRTDRCIQCHVL